MRSPPCWRPKLREIDGPGDVGVSEIVAELQAAALQKRKILRWLGSAQRCDARIAMGSVRCGRGVADFLDQFIGAYWSGCSRDGTLVDGEVEAARFKP